MEMKTSPHSYSDKKVLWNKDSRKILVKIHERYLCGGLLLKLQVMQLFWKLTPLQVFLKKSIHSLNWLLLLTLIVQHKLFFTILATMIFKN